jgi:hypothetical protein
MRNSTGGGFFRGDLVKLDHNTGAYLQERGNDKVLIETGAERTVNPIEMVDTWSKYLDGERVEHKVYRTAAGEMAPLRDQLGDTDEHEWPRDKRGSPKDPWARAVYLPMKGGDGEIVCFKATGRSAIAEIAELVGMYGSADRHGKFPIVRLESRSFERHGYTIHVPRFTLVGWEFWEEGVPAPEVAPVMVPIEPPPAKALVAPKRSSAHVGDMDDEIPF